VKEFLYGASEKKRRSPSASPGSHDEQVVTSTGFTAEGGSRVPPKQSVGLVRAIAGEFPETAGVVRGDGAAEGGGRKTQQVTALLDHRGADVGDRPDVGESDLTVRPSDEIPRGANGRSGFRREIDADENAKRAGHLGDSNCSDDAISPPGAVDLRMPRLDARAPPERGSGTREGWSFLRRS
jgi:hypothetical protein